jgi:hypothetical protein
MRLVRAGFLASLVVAAGCAGGHHRAAPDPFPPQPPGVYVARVVVRPGSPGQARAATTAWLDTATGRFRVRTVYSRRDATLAVYDGRVGTRGFGRQVWTYRGSPGFVTELLGSVPIAAMREYLSGAPAEAGIQVRGGGHGWPAVLSASTRSERMTLSVRPLRSAPAGLFRTIRGHLLGTTRQVAAGTRPPAGVPGYWLGPTFHGRRPTDASQSTATSGGNTTVSYRGLEVDSSSPLGQLRGDRAVTLADGTHARMTVIPISPGGTYSYTDGSGGFDTLAIASGPGDGRDIALIFLPNAMITLSGPAVTPTTAPAIARALRPL